jgi:hypothetical protein
MQILSGIAMSEMLRTAPENARDDGSPALMGEEINSQPEKTDIWMLLPMICLCFDWFTNNAG